jgi:hypothetical protein
MAHRRPALECQQDLSKQAPSPSVPSSCQLPQAFSLKSQNAFSDALVCQPRPTLEHLWALSLHSHLQGFLACHNTLPNQATPPRSPIIPQGPLSPPCPIAPCPHKAPYPHHAPAPCPHGPHGPHNPSALPIIPLVSTIYPHCILPWLIHETYHSLIHSPRTLSCIPRLSCCPSFTPMSVSFHLQEADPLPRCHLCWPWHGRENRCPQYRVFAILQWSQFSTFKKDV